MAPYPPTTDLNVPEAAAATAHASDPTPSLPAVQNHPAYAEMITDAIASLNEANGSNKRAIAKYIEARHSNLPPTHSSLLTPNLQRLRDEGQILMFKHSYKLAGSVPAPPVSVNGADSVGQKKRPGRPPKHKSVQAAVPVFGEQSMPQNPVPDTTPQLHNAVTALLGSVNVAAAPVFGPVVGGIPRGRGRPPKQGGVKRGRGRPKVGGGVQAIVGRSRGRPKKNAASPVMAGNGRGPGRPRKVANVGGGLAAVDGGTVGSMAFGVVTGGASIVAGGGLSQVAGKRRGRPPKEVGREVKKRRKLSGKPLGRPKKTALTAGSRAPVNPQQIVGLDLKGKLQYFQSRIKQTVNIIKPHLSSEAAFTALRELETLAEMDVNAPLNIPHQS
ncbi:uncharacterized protein LOC142542367 [Primulina tabacum]|uniref:uncharacterized protein LOC142542367 n=1 Tax=Primulina tabacum TaxID=48773 RepID=UPI003F59FF43